MPAKSVISTFKKAAKRALKYGINNRRGLIALGITLGVVSFFGLAAFFITHSHAAREKAWLVGTTEAFRKELEATVAAARRTALYAARRDVLRNSEILGILEKANAARANAKISTQLRERLLASTALLADRLAAVGIEHLTFFLPDGKTFLRHDFPGRFGDFGATRGDDLRTLPGGGRGVEGFNAASTWSGYSFLFSIERSGRRIGLVEMAIPYTTLSRLLGEFFGARTFFIENAEEVSRMFGEASSGYTPVPFDERFVLREAFVKTYNDFVADAGLALANQRTASRIGARLASGDAFSEFFETASGFAGVTFLPVSGTGENPAYAIAFGDDPGYPLMLAHQRLQMVLFLLLFLLAAGVGGAVLLSRQRLERMATRDRLTGALNRHIFLELAERKITRAHRKEMPLSMLLFDIDHFKEINDTHGHKAGDFVLKKLAATIASETRPYDIFCRWGGDEFLLLMPETNAEAGRSIAERMRECINEINFFQIKNVSVSIGIITGDDFAEGIQKAIERADAHMYQAKSEGRNRVA